MSAVAGAVAIVIVLLLLPVLVVMSGAIGAAILGESLWRDGAARNADSELTDLNV